MKLYRWGLNILILFFTLYVVSGFQTTFWYQIFGNIPSPLLWLIVYVYIMLYRPSALALVLSYIFMIVVFSMSAVSLGILSLSVFVLFVGIYMTKSRLYWGGAGYFSLMCTAAAFFFHVIFWLGSAFFESNPSSLLFFDRIVQVLLTPLFSFPLYYWLQAVDRWTLSDMTWQQEYKS
ncbi:MAG: hypothetical protein V4736_11180 [Bdellovibrionota bacterium]